MKNEDEIIDLTQDNIQAISLEEERKPEQQIPSVSPIQNNYSATYAGNSMNDNIEGFVFGDIASTNGMQTNYSNTTNSTINNMDTGLNSFSKESNTSLGNTSMNEVPFMPSTESTVGSAISDTNTQFNTISEEQPMEIYERLREPVLDNTSMNEVAFKPNSDSTVDTTINSVNTGVNIGSQESAFNNTSMEEVSFIPNYENKVEPAINNMNTGFNPFSEVPIEIYQDTAEVSDNPMSLNVEKPLTNGSKNIEQTFEDIQEMSKPSRSIENSKTSTFKNDSMSHDSNGNVTFMIVFALILLVITFLLPYISGYK